MEVIGSKAKQSLKQPYRTCLGGVCVVLTLTFSVYASLMTLALPTTQAAETTQATETTTDKITQARQLKLEGSNLQLRGNIAEAVKKYRDSLALQPDEKLAALTSKLEKQLGVIEVAQPIQASVPEKTPAASSTVSTPEKLPSQKPEPPAQAAPHPAAIPEAVIPAAAAPPANVDDSFGQYRLVEKLSSFLQGGVIKGSEAEVYLNLGQAHGVSEGMFFEIVRPGAPIKIGDKVIGYEETKIATVEASTVRDKLSICQIKTKTGIPQTGDKAYEQRKKIKRLVVGQFTFNQGVNQLTKTVQEKLVTAFAAKGLQVVERDRLEKVLQEQQLGYSGLINIDSAKKIGELLGAEGIILGTVNDMGNEISLNGRMVDIGSGNTLSAGEVNLVKTPLVVQQLEAQVKEDGPAVAKTKPGGNAKKDKKLAVQEKEGFEFALNGCKKADTTITCEYTITNTQEDRKLKCYSTNAFGKGSILYDNFGNSYSASQITLANCNNEGHACEKGLIRGVPTQASLTFEKIASDAVSAPKTSIVCQATDAKGRNAIGGGGRNPGELFSVEFRDIVCTNK